MTGWFKVSYFHTLHKTSKNFSFNNTTTPHSTRTTTLLLFHLVIQYTGAFKKKLYGIYVVKIINFYQVDIAQL